MAYVVTLNCLGTKDRACVEVCPVDCFYNITNKELNDKFNKPPKADDDVGMLMIHPDECISCGACGPECPVEAIFEDSAVPADMQEFIALNQTHTTSLSEAELEACRVTSK